MAIAQNLMIEHEDMLDVDNQSLEPTGVPAPSASMATTGITIEWLRERISELEAVNAALRAPQSPDRESYASA